MAAQAKVLSGNKLKPLMVRLQRHSGAPQRGLLALDYPARDPVPRPDCIRALKSVAQGNGTHRISSRSTPISSPASHGRPSKCSRASSRRASRPLPTASGGTMTSGQHRESTYGMPLACIPAFPALEACFSVRRCSKPPRFTWTMAAPSSFAAKERDPMSRRSSSMGKSLPIAGCRCQRFV